MRSRMLDRLFHAVGVLASLSAGCTDRALGDEATGDGFMESSGAAADSLTSEGFAPREEPTSPFYSTIDEPRPLFVLCVPQQGGCLRLTIAPVEAPSYEFELEEGYWTASGCLASTSSVRELDARTTEFDVFFGRGSMFVGPTSLYFEDGGEQQLDRFEAPPGEHACIFEPAD